MEYVGIAHWYSYGWFLGRSIRRWVGLRYRVFFTNTNGVCASQIAPFVGPGPGAIPFLSEAGSPASPVRFSVNPTTAQRSITLRLKISGWASTNEFGYYLLSTPGTLNPLFTSAQAQGTVVNMIPGGPFAFYLKNQIGQTFTSQANYNFVLFSQTPANPATPSTDLSSYYIGAEDKPLVAGPYGPGPVAGTDADYNDFIMQIVVPPSDPPPPNRGCVLTQVGYKNHFKYLVVQAAGVGLGTAGKTYTPAQIAQIFGTPVAGNGLISLAHQLITAKLNISYGAAAPATVLNAITAADAIIGALIVPPIGNGSLTPAQTSALTTILDDFNNGKYGTPLCN